MKNFRLIAAICAALLIAAPAMALEVEISGHYFLETFNHSNQLLNKTFIDRNDSANYELGVGYPTKETSRNEYGSMELMIKPVFKINDNITLTTQFTALEDHVWGDDAKSKLNEDDPFAPDIDDSNNIDWKAAYMTIKTSIGGFIIGRYIDTPWGGIGLGDSTASHGSNDRHKDRIMWVVPTGDFISGLVAQRNNEGDKGNEITDGDNHKYYGFSAYKQENWSTGLLIANYQYKSFVNQADLRAFQKGYATYTEQVDAATKARGTYTATYNQALELAAPLGATGLVQAARFDENESGTLDATLVSLGREPIDLYGLNSAATDAEGAAAYTADQYHLQEGPTYSKLDVWLFDPYFRGTFGSLSVETELIYGIGKVELDEARKDPVSGREFDELDAEALLATIDLKYDIAGFTFNAGYTYVQGDSDYTDDDTNAAGYLEPSVDLEHGFLLTSDVSGLERTLGGTDANGVPLGNLAGGPTTLTGTAGYQMYWLGVKYAVLDNLRIGLLYVDSKADDAPFVNPDSGTGPRWDDDHGEEYDFTVEWDIMDNLSFNGVVAHLSAGDYWKQGDASADIEDNTTIYGRLILEF
jgi:hypothetical protein